MSQLADGHDNFCDCNSPFSHLLASIFPPGHKDRDFTINQILQRDFKECHSGGTGEESHGLAGGENIEETPIKEENTQEGDVEDLLLAAAAAATERDAR